MNTRTSQSPPAGWPASIAYSPMRMRIVQLGFALVALALVFVAGRLTGSSAASNSQPETHVAESAKPTTWICSMHPQIRLPKFGQCPICFMDLIPETEGGAASGEAVLTLSPRAGELARIETVEVRPRAVTCEIPMVGKVAADETRITYISSYIPGRLDRVYVDYTGILVRKGDHLAEIYSPELLVAQREFLLAMNNLERARDLGDNEMARDSAAAVLQAARRKLELWGIPRDEIERLARHQQPSDHMRLDAPTTGWVTERNGYAGMYVETGTRLFTVTDLTRVWVLLDAYESDVRLIRYGQSVEFETESFAGQTFTGTVAFIDPTLNENTRTVKVRLNVANADLRLRPGMFVRARLHVQLGAGGDVISDALAGQYICPMHPEIIKPAPGTCDECGMDLVRPESLGYAASRSAAEKVLAVPASSVLLTGRRAVVYVEQMRDGRPIYEGREIVPGPRAGDWYVVASGLSEGDRVVTRGAILIDSAMQIQARPSMMQPQDALTAGADGGPVPAAATSAPHYVVDAPYHKQAAPVLAAFLELTQALGDDNIERSRAALGTLADRVNAARPDGLSGAAGARFAEAMQTIADTLPNGDLIQIDSIRNALPRMNRAVEDYLRAFGHPGNTHIYRVYCPMAFNDKGAYWLQSHTTVHNAYFGSKMLRCGVVEAEIKPDGSEAR